MVFGGFVTIVGSVNVEVDGWVVDDNERFRFLGAEMEIGWLSESESDDSVCDEVGNVDDLGGVRMLQMSSSSESEDKCVVGGFCVKAWTCNASTESEKDVWFCLWELVGTVGNFDGNGVLDFSE